LTIPVGSLSNLPFIHMPKTAISPTRSENYPEWYQQVVRAADLAENSPVRGCMVIRPWGYALWEYIQRNLDTAFKNTGVENAYFPLFIPMSYLEKEAAHVEGFAKECAVVTHHRLEEAEPGKLKPAGELDEPLIVRPTSETIIGEMFAKWVQSYRDLPLLINQWANVVRWEMRTRLFLRTTEFLWQEGHTVHASREEAEERTRQMLDVYADFAENFMAMPVVKGIKTPGETFPGAVQTLCIEAMMQDRKALQAGTSHFLGQNFAKASGIEYADPEGTRSLAWTTSWGVSTRLIGGMIMTHADDDGMRLPPKLAPQQVVILPVIHKEETRAGVMAYCETLATEIRQKQFAGEPVRVSIDQRDLRGGEKTWSWIKKGLPVWLEIGPRDIEKGNVFMGRRDQTDQKKQSLSRQEFLDTLPDILGDIQTSLYQQALDFRKQHTTHLDTKEDIVAFFTPKNSKQPEIHGGFAQTHWDGSEEAEKWLKDNLNVTIRCIPLDAPEEKGTCPITGNPSIRRVILGKSY